jgi:RNA polymerase sigma-70 factor (ECF subfamily)
VKAMGLRVIPGGAGSAGDGRSPKGGALDGQAERSAGPSGLLKAPQSQLQELYEKHAAAVYGRCRYLLRDDAEARDALQDVFVKVLHALSDFRAAASPSTWILRISTHHCLNVIRAKKAQWRDQLKALNESKKVETETPDRRELVRVLLSAAPEEAQEVAVLYYVDELTQAEIAQELSRSLPTIRKRLREFLACARAALKEAMPGAILPEGDDL